MGIFLDDDRAYLDDLFVLWIIYWIKAIAVVSQNQIKKGFYDRAKSWGSAVRLTC